jgi:hypothetical protein
VGLFGRFERGELIFVSAPDMGVQWTRAGQSPEGFEASVVDAILRMRGREPQGDTNMRGREGGRASALARHGQMARAW